MKILFLDFDGVLNFHNSFHDEDYANRFPLDRNIMPNLKLIIEKTDAIIVLTTTWKEYWDAFHPDDLGKKFNECFAEFGLTITNKTSDIGILERAYEIELYLKQVAFNPKEDTFCILDDLDIDFSTNSLLKNNFVHTNAEFGITKEDALKAIAILNNE